MSGSPAPTPFPRRLAPAAPPSTGRLIVKILSVLFAMETVSHLVSRRLLLGRAGSLLDSLVLCAAAGPVFFFWLRSHMRGLASSEARYRILLRSIGNGVSVVDSDYNVLMVNPALERLLGKPASELVGRRCFHAYEERGEKGSQCPGRPAMQSGKPQEAKLDNILKDGRKVKVRLQAFPLFADDGKPAGFIELVEDVTAQEIDKQRLRDAQRQQAALNDLLRISMEPAPLPAKLGRMLACLLATPWFEIERKGAVFMPSGSAMLMAAQVGLSAPVLSGCARLAPGQCLCGRAAASGDEILAVSLDARHSVYPGMEPHGHFILPLKGGGETLGVLCLYLKDGLKLGAEQIEFARSAAGVFSGVILLAKSEERLVQSQKMDAIGKLTGGIAHDFNNLLTVILGNGHIALAQLDAGLPAKPDVASMMEAANRAAALTRQLLAFSRKQVLAPRRTDLNSALDGTRSMLERLVGEDVALALIPAPVPLPVNIDTGQLEQVVVNLIVNARDAMPAGGRITMRLSREELARELRHSHGGVPAGAYAALAIGDTGAGMTEEVLSRLFEPFFTTKPVGKGTGLGLSTAYGIIAQSRGHMTVQSKPGAGATFTIYLPIDEGAIQPARGEEGPPAQRRGEGAVLVVEDEPAVRELARRVLEGNGFTVVTASSPGQALAELRRRKDGLRLMLTDVVMPQMSGIELAQKAQAAAPAMKVLFMSGYADHASWRGGGAPSAEGLLQKPFSPRALLERVHKTLDEKGV